MVANLDGTHLQNVAGFLEPGESRPEHHPDFARSGMALEMGGIPFDRVRHFHAFLLEEFSTAIRGLFASSIAPGGQKGERPCFFRELETLYAPFCFRSRLCPDGLHFWKKEADRAG
jgi:hypothetical protein